MLTAVRRLLLIFMLAVLLVSSSRASVYSVFINELHYENAGPDIGEFVEIAGPGGLNLTGWSLVLYNGATGAVYQTINLSGTISARNALAVSTPLIQNGPDGIALIDADSNVVQFLSYEGFFMATDGIANGATSVDIGVSESNADPVGLSLQLWGNGIKYDDYTWRGPLTSSPGTENTDQVVDLGVLPEPVPAVQPTGRFGLASAILGLGLVGIAATRRRRTSQEGREKVDSHIQ